MLLFLYFSQYGPPSNVNLGQNDRSYPARSPCFCLGCNQTERVINPVDSENRLSEYPPLSNSEVPGTTWAGPGACETRSRCGFPLSPQMPQWIHPSGVHSQVEHGRRGACQTGSPQPCPHGTCRGSWSPPPGSTVGTAGRGVPWWESTCSLCPRVVERWPYFLIVSTVGGKKSREVATLELRLLTSGSLNTFLL